MLNRQYLDLRCSSNDPGRVRDERCRIDEHPTDPNAQQSPQIEPCGVGNFNYKPEAGDCPTVNALRERITEAGKPPPYFPQLNDNVPAIDEGPMGPVGPWATGRPVFSPVNGMTGIRPVVDRYSMTRYTPAQWRSHNKTFFDQSSRMISNARTLAKDVREHNSRAYRETDKNQLENRDRLSGRSGEIHYWKMELERAIIELTDEIELLEAEHRRVKQSLSVLTIPESIAGEFLQIRSTRMEPDLVRDKVEDELVKETALCSVVRNILNKTRESIEDQLLELKAVKTRLEFDLTDKVDAYANDSACIGLTNDSPLIMMKPGATRVPPEQSSPEGYDNFTKVNLESSENTRQKSIALRATLNDTYLKVVKDLRQQATEVDLALTDNVNVTEQVCQALEKELVNCLNQLSDTEKLIEELRGANRGLEEAMKVAQTRLDIRHERRNVENCRDIPQYGLIEEVKIIGENLTSMAGQLRQAEETQAGLVKSRGDLEREIMEFQEPQADELEKEAAEEKLYQDSVVRTSDCSLPLNKWATLAQQTGSRPSVDKFTVSRFSPGEWYLHNEAVAQNAFQSINDIKNEAFSLEQIQNEIYHRVDENQLNNKYYLTVNARALFNRKRELELINKDVIDELESIKNLIQQLMKSDRAIESIKKIVQDLKCLRNTRLEHDLVHDAVTEEILKEEELCKEKLKLNKKCFERVKQQLNELKEAKQRVEYDWSCKKDAYHIDTGCLALNNISKNLEWKPGCAQLPAGQCTPLGHEQFTDESIAYAQIAINRSRVLKTTIRDHIDKLVKDLLLQACQVDISLTNKFNETDQACRRLEQALLECSKSLADSEKVIVNTSKAIRKLDAPSKCAQTRLSMRLERLNIEHCRDIPQFSLIDELKDISVGVSALSTKINNTKNITETLDKSYKKIQHEIMVKRKSLWIDGERCRMLRSFYPSEQTLYGY